MAQGARVQTIDAIREFRGRLIEFNERAGQALAEAEFEIRRTIQWLRHDQTAYWKHVIAQNSKLLENAKSELFRAEVSEQQSGGSARDERQRVKKLQRRIEEAERKLAAIQRWVKTLEKELSTYRAGCNALAGQVASELPAARDELKQIAGQLDKYVQSGSPQNRKSAAESDAEAVRQSRDDEDEPDEHES